MPQLAAPTLDVHASFLAAMDEFRTERVSGSQTAGWIQAWGECWQDPDGFAEFIEWLHHDALEDSPRPEAWVETTTLWWLDGSDYLGRLGIRHRLNDFLIEGVGHIGYDVRPSRRGEGQATAMLRASLPYARELGIEQALVTCDIDNVASLRVIEAAGGVLEDVRSRKRRYWVATRS